MTAQSKNTIKAYFETGDQPSQAQFSNLIDSYQDAATVLTAISSSSWLSDAAAKVAAGATGSINILSNVSANVTSTTVIPTPTSADARKQVAVNNNGTPAYRLVDPVFFNVKDFGAVADGVTDDSTAIQAAINLAKSYQAGIVFFPPTSAAYYLNTTSLTVFKGVCLKGSGHQGSTITVNTVSPPSAIVFGSAASDIEICDLQLQVRGAGNIGIQLKGCPRSYIHDNRIFHPVTGVGTSIQLDVNSVSGAYNHYVHNNDLDSANIGIQMVNGNNACVIQDNKIISDNAIVVANGGGGNVYTKNLLQSKTAGPTGTGISFSGASSGEEISENYFDHYSTGISFSASCSANYVGPNHWDTVTTKINDSSTNARAASVLDGELGAMSLGSTTMGGKNTYQSAGDSSAENIGFRTVDYRGGGGQWSFLNGSAGAGFWSLRNDANGHSVLKGSDDNLVVAGTVQVAAAATVRSGSGSPNGAVSGSNGDIFLRTDGTGGARLYVCAGTTTWAAVATV